MLSCIGGHSNPIIRFAAEFGSLASGKCKGSTERTFTVLHAQNFDIEVPEKVLKIFHNGRRSVIKLIRAQL